MAINRRRKRTLFVFLLFGWIALHIVGKLGESSSPPSLDDVKARMRGPLSPFDRSLIQEVLNSFLVPPSSKELSLKFSSSKNTGDVYENLAEQTSWKFYKEEIRNLFTKRSSSKGFYVEAGAFDGEFMSNTLYLEMELGWNGLLIEPDNELFQELLKRNRKAWSCHCCLSTKPFPHETILKKVQGSKVDEVQILSKTYNAITESPSFDTRSQLGFPVFERVQCIPLESLLIALNQTHVDLVSLDIEDIEQEFLKQFDWDTISVDVWFVEHRHSSTALGTDKIDYGFIDWFSSKGYVLYKAADEGLDYIFIKEDSNYYHKNWKRLFL